MIKKTYPVVLEFEFDVEYSIDDGSNWTALAANTRVEINGENLPTSKKVMVRSTVDDALVLNNEKLETNRRIFESINIRNARKVSTLNNLLKYSVIDKFRINNAPGVLSANSLMYNAYVKQADICELPSCTDFSYFAYKANIKELSEVKGKLDTTCNYGYMFYDANIGKSGRLWFSGSSETQYNNNFYYSFAYSNFELFPYIEIHDVLRSNGSNECRYVFNSVKTKYFLYSKLYTESSLDTSKDYYSGSVISGYYSRFMNDSQARFAGFDCYIHIPTNMSTNNDSEYLMYNNQYATSLYSRYVKTNNYIYSSSNCFKNNPKIDDSKFPSTLTTSDYVILEDPEWLPIFSELDIYNGSELISTGMLSSVNDRIVKIDNGNKYVAKWADRHDDKLEFNDPVAHGLASDTVWYSRNGYYAVQDGDDIKFYDNTDTALGTVTTTPDFAQMNADGSVFYTITGQRVDTGNTGNQQVVQTVTAINTSDGSTLFTFDITNETNEEILGIYCPDNDSKIQMLFTDYVENGGVLEPNSSRVKSYDTAGSKVFEQNLSELMFEVFPSFAESAEFICINRNVSPSRVTRCFGS